MRAYVNVLDLQSSWLKPKTRFSENPKKLIFYREYRRRVPARRRIKKVWIERTKLGPKWLQRRCIPRRRASQRGPRTAQWPPTGNLCQAPQGRLASACEPCANITYEALLLLFVAYLDLGWMRHTAFSQKSSPECISHENLDFQRGCHAQIMVHEGIFLYQSYLPGTHYNRS